MRHATYAKLVFASALILSACATNTSDERVGPVKADFESFKTASCPGNTPFVMPEKFATTAKDVGWGDGAAKKLSPLEPIATYELNSDNPRFGGLSGLDFLDGNTLLMVADKGDLFWMDIEDEAPANSGYLALLRGADGQPLQGKSQSDAEGVTWNGEYAFVSFERDHRVLGYDIEGCGGNARGIKVAGFAPDAFGTGSAIEKNSGLEALSVFGDGLITGLETRVRGGAPVGKILPDTDISFDLLMDVPDYTQLVGLAMIENKDSSGRLYALSRSYDPIRGNRNGIVISDVSPEGIISPPTVSVTFDKSLAIDNYEGIAVRSIDAHTDRIILISDDNFSDQQRTLLAILDYHHAE